MKTECPMHLEAIECHHLGDEFVVVEEVSWCPEPIVTWGKVGSKGGASGRASAYRDSFLQWMRDPLGK